MNFKEIVELLLTDQPWRPNSFGHDIRTAFFRDPGKFMTALGLNNPNDRAYLCSLNASQIGQRANVDPELITAFDDYMKGENCWPPMGNASTHPWEDRQVCEPPPSPLDDPSARWSGPQHRIVKVFTERIYKSHEKPFVVMGEGYLPGATMTFRQQGAPARFFKVQLGSDAASYHSCSIRQVYLRVALLKAPAHAPVGNYTLAIANQGWAQLPEDGPDIPTIQVVA